MFNSPPEITLGVVLHSVPRIVTTGKVKENLMDSGLENVVISRMYKKIDGTRTVPNEKIN